MCNNLLHALGQQSKQYKHQRHNNPQALHSGSPAASVKRVSVSAAHAASYSSPFLFFFFFGRCMYVEMSCSTVEKHTRSQLQRTSERLGSRHLMADAESEIVGSPKASALFNTRYQPLLNLKWKEPGPNSTSVHTCKQAHVHKSL